MKAIGLLIGGALIYFFGYCHSHDDGWWGAKRTSGDRWPPLEGQITTDPGAGP